MKGPPSTARRAGAWSAGLLALGLAAACNSPADPAKDPVKSSAPPAVSAGDVELPGLDTSQLTAREKKEWNEQVQELLAPCPSVPVNLAQCVKEKRPCAACQPAAGFLLKLIRRGVPRKQRGEVYELRFAQSKVKTVVLDGSPVKGPADAPVTIVEWADFQCPGCRAASPLLDYLVERFPDQVRFVYKFYPLPSHPQGDIAARAGFAAFQQGKFWELHHVMFDHQDKLEQADLEKYAKKLGLDIEKFRDGLTDKKTAEKIEADKKQAESLGLQGTPMIFVNGREMPLEIFPPNTIVEDIEEWIEIEIRMAGQSPKPPPKGLKKPFDDPPPAPSGSASAGAPDASASAPPAASASAAAGSKGK